LRIPIFFVLSASSLFSLLPGVTAALSELASKTLEILVNILGVVIDLDEKGAFLLVLLILCRQNRVVCDCSDRSKSGIGFGGLSGVFRRLSNRFLRESRRDGSEQRKDADCLDRERKDRRQIVAACLHLLLDDEHGVMWCGVV